MPLPLPLHLNWLKATLDTVLLTCSRPTRQTRLVASVLNIKTLGYHYPNVLRLATTEPPFFHFEFCNWDHSIPPPPHTHTIKASILSSVVAIFPLISHWSTLLNDIDKQQPTTRSQHQLISQSVTSPGHFAKTACKKTRNITSVKRGLCDVAKRCFAKWLRAIIIMNQPWALGQDCIQEDSWCRFNEERPLRRGNKVLCQVT